MPEPGAGTPPAAVMLFVPYVPEDARTVPAAEDSPRGPWHVTTDESSPWDAAILELLAVDDPSGQAASGRIDAGRGRLEPSGAPGRARGRGRWERLSAAVLDVLAEYGVVLRLGGVMQSQPTRLAGPHGEARSVEMADRWALVVIGEVPMVRAAELEARLRATVQGAGVAPMWLSITPAVRSVTPVRGPGGLRIVE